MSPFSFFLSFFYIYVYKVFVYKKTNEDVVGNKAYNVDETKNVLKRAFCFTHSLIQIKTKALKRVMESPLPFPPPNVYFMERGGGREAGGSCLILLSEELITVKNYIKYKINKVR